MTDELAMALQTTQPPAGRRTALEFVREALRQAILTGGLRGGTRLVQSSIASALQVSTTPVREALRDLSSEGLVIMDSHRGAIVRTVDNDEVREIYQIRAALEPLMIQRTVERITDTELDSLVALQNKLDKCTDFPEFLTMNRRFHDLLAEAAQWPLLTTYLKSLHDRALIYIGETIHAEPNITRRSRDEHHEIIEACRRRDIAAAREVMERHVRSTGENLLGHPLDVGPE